MPFAGGTIVSAESVQAGGFMPPTPPNASAAGMFRTLPAFCRVTARLTPTPDSDIRVEVWLPRSDWNRKFEGVGNGGLGGTISYPALAAAVTAGYAAAATDTGHVGGNGDFVPGHPEKLVDFAYRAIHDMTVSAKTSSRRTTMRARRGPTSARARREAGRRSSKRSATRRISTGSWQVTRPGTRCGSMPPGSP
jgi:feruloyl esterase